MNCTVVNLSRKCTLIYKLIRHSLRPVTVLKNCNHLYKNLKKAAGIYKQTGTTDKNGSLCSHCYYSLANSKSSDKACLNYSVSKQVRFYIIKLLSDSKDISHTGWLSETDWMVTVFTRLRFSFLFLLIKDSYFPKLQMVIAFHGRPTELTGGVDAYTAVKKPDKPQNK